MPDELEVVTPLQEITRAEIDMQIATAKKYKRSLETFRTKALSMATADQEVAASCFYKLKRRGEGGDAFIEGPSVRLAEIVANAWGNVRFGARGVGESAKDVTSQGVCHDLEQNVLSTIEVSRRITTRDGRRFSDDMVQVTKNACNSIALRNAIFKVIPMSYIKPIYEACKKTAVGTSKTVGERRQAMIQALTAMRVTKEQIVEFLEVKSIEDIGLKEIETMIGVHTAIKNGDTSVDDQFRNKTEMPKKKNGTEAPVAPAAPGEAQEENPAEDRAKGLGYDIVVAIEPGKCKLKTCAQPFKKGARIAFNATKGTYHVDCAQ